MNAAGLQERREDARTAWRMAHEHADYLEVAYSTGRCTLDEVVIANERAWDAWHALVALHRDAEAVVASFRVPV